MNEQIRVLLIDDSEKDARQVMRVLQTDDLSCEFERVESVANLQAALTRSNWDAIIINLDILSLPVSMAVAVIHELANDTPYIIISKKTDEKAAVDLMGSGASGFIVKENLLLLAPVTRRVLKEARNLREKQDATAALHESNRRFQILFEQSPFGIVVFDPSTGKPVEFNSVACRQLGYTHEEFSHLKIKDFEVYETPEEIDRHVDAVFKNGLDIFDTRHRTKQGELRAVRVSVQPLVQGDTTYLHCIYVDVTDQLKADNALAVSEQNFREIFNSTPDAIFIHDAETGEIIDVNDTVLKMYGFASREDAMSEKNIQMLQADAMFSEEKGRELVLKANFSGPRVFEWHSKRTDGSQFWAEISLNRALINGKDRVLAVVRDISERKRIEEALTYSEERYRLLFKEMSEGFALHEIIVDKKGKPVDYRFLDVNPAFEKLTGLKREKIVGFTVKEVIPATEPFWIEKYGEVALHGGEIQFENYHAGIGKWYNVTAFCPEKGQFAVTFEDITDRKKSETALRESEAQFRSTFEQTTVAMSMVTLDGQFMRVNQAFSHLLGYEQEELVGQSSRLVTHPDDWPLSEQYLAKSQVSDTKNIQFEKRYVHKSGRVVWVNLSSTVIRDSSGNPRYFITQIQDITEQKSAEEALHLREKIFTHSLDMLFVAGFDGYFKILNPAWESNLGWEISELTGKPWIEFVHPDDRESTQKSTLTLTENNNEILQFENRYICKDGRYRWLSWNSYPYPKESIIVGVARDITEKRALDESLRQSEERYHLIDEASSDFIYSYDLSGRFTHANSALCKGLGTTIENIIGKTHSELGFPPDQCEEWERLHRQVYDTNSTVVSETTATINGENRYFEVVLNPMHDIEGEIIGISGTTRDIHARKKAEMKIQEQMDELRRWNTVTLGRENRILELKNEVNQLLNRLGEEEKYSDGTRLEITHGE